MDLPGLKSYVQSKPINQTAGLGFCTSPFRPKARLKLLYATFLPLRSSLEGYTAWMYRIHAVVQDRTSLSINGITRSSCKLCTEGIEEHAAASITDVLREPPTSVSYFKYRFPDLTFCRSYSSSNA